MSTNTTLPAHTRLTPLRKWWGSTRLAYRIAWQDLRRHTASTVLALLLVIVPIVAIVTYGLAASAVTSDHAAQYANPQSAIIATVDAKVTENYTKTADVSATPQEILDDLTGRGATSVWGYGLTRHYEGRGTYTKVAHLMGDVDDSSPLELLDGRWPENDKELAVTPGGTLQHLKVGDKVDLNRSSEAQAISYTVVGICTGPLAATFKGEHKAPVSPTAVTRAVPQQAKDLTSWTFYVDTPNPDTFLSSIRDTPLAVSGQAVWHAVGPSYTGIFNHSAGGLVDGLGALIPMLLLSFALIALMSTPALLIAFRRHNTSLSIAGHQGASPSMLTHVMNAHAILLVVTTTAVSTLIIAAFLYAIERWLRSPSVGSYGYATVVYTVFVGLVLASLTAGMLIASKFLAHRASTAATRTTTTRTPGISVPLAVSTITLTVLTIAALVATVDDGPLGEISMLATPLLLLLLALHLAPITLTLLSKLPGPAWLRFGLRDANLNRARTVPIVGAVTAATALAVFASTFYQVVYVSQTDQSQADSSPSVTTVDIAYSASSKDRLDSDASRVAKMVGVTFASPQAVTHPMPFVTYYDAAGFVPQPGLASSPVDTVEKNILTAMHPSCQVGPTPNPAIDAPGQRFLGRVTCTHNFTGPVASSAASGLYSERVSILTADQAERRFSLSAEAKQAFEQGAVLWHGTTTFPAYVKLFGWSQEETSSGDWVYSEPRAMEVPTVKLADSGGLPLGVTAVASPALAERLGLDTTPTSLHVVLAPDATSAHLDAIYEALPLAAKPAVPLRRPENLQRAETVGLWIGGTILLLFVALLTLLSNKQVVREANTISMLGGRRSFVRLSLASQLGALTTLGIVMGTSLALLFLAVLMWSKRSALSFTDMLSDSMLIAMGRVTTLASWPTLLSVMVTVVLASMVIAASTAPLAKLGAKRQ